MYGVFLRHAPVVMAVSCDEAFLELAEGTDPMAAATQVRHFILVRLLSGKIHVGGHTRCVWIGLGVPRLLPAAGKLLIRKQVMIWHDADKSVNPCRLGRRLCTSRPMDHYRCMI